MFKGQSYAPTPFVGGPNAAPGTGAVKLPTEALHLLARSNVLVRLKAAFTHSFHTSFHEGVGTALRARDNDYVVHIEPDKNLF